MNVLGIARGDAQKFLRGVGYECRSLGADEGEWIAYPNKAEPLLSPRGQ